jgi:hypothetical protein
MDRPALFVLARYMRDVSRIDDRWSKAGQHAVEVIPGAVLAPDRSPA